VRLLEILLIGVGAAFVVAGAVAFVVGFHHIETLSRSLEQAGITCCALAYVVGLRHRHRRRQG
jgi:hypothetical protein